MNYSDIINVLKWEEQIYWDEINGKVTKEQKNVPIIKGKDIYIEIYEIYGTNNVIAIAYTQATKENENMYYYRKSILNMHKLDYCDLGKLIKFVIPNDKYNLLVEEMKGV